MTPQEVAAAVIDGSNLDFGAWADDPANVLGAVVGRAADSRFRAQRAHLCHVACALVVAADNPYIVRGAVLDQLVKTYGSGL